MATCCKSNSTFLIFAVLVVWCRRICGLVKQTEISSRSIIITVLWNVIIISLLFGQEAYTLYIYYRLTCNYNCCRVNVCLFFCVFDCRCLFLPKKWVQCHNNQATMNDWQGDHTIHSIVMLAETHLAPIIYFTVGAHVLHEAPKKMFVVPLHFLVVHVRLVVLVIVFAMASTVWSVSCLLFVYSRCTRALWSRRRWSSCNRLETLHT